METVKVFKVNQVDLKIRRTHLPELHIAAVGENLNNNYQHIRLERVIEIVPPADGIYTFSFIGDIPPMVDTINTPASAETEWKSFPADLKGVKILAASNDLTQLLPSGNHRLSEQADPSQWTGISVNFSIEEAFKDAISKAPNDIPTDYFKYKITEIGYEEGGFAQVHNLYVKIVRLNDAQ